MSSDRHVQATNDDATISKLSCVNAGYFSDPFVKHFVRRPARRSPVINRGYFARWAAIRGLIDSFLEIPRSTGAGSGSSSVPTSSDAVASESKGQQGGRKMKLQIISLGAGYDTLYLNLKAANRQPHKYLEVDFPEVIANKKAILSTRKELSSVVGPLDKLPGGGGISSDGSYSLVVADLRHTDKLHSALEAAGADFTQDTLTLFLSECVLIYMDPESSDSLVAWAARSFPSSAFISYEQIRPDDAFGQQMTQNLEIRGCPLLGLRATPTLEAKKQRYIDHGYQRADAWDMRHIYSKFVDQNEVQRTDKLEIFDEFEEWHLMQEHYCIAIGVRDSTGLLEGYGFKEM